MFKYDGKEYRTKTDATDKIVIQSAIIQKEHKQADRIAILETIKKHQEIIHRLYNLRNEIIEESEKIRSDYIKQEESKIINQEYQFISTGFFIEGTIENLTDTEMIMKCDQNYIAYDIIKANNTIFTKPKPITVKRRYDALKGYKPIGISDYYLILQNDQNVIMAHSDMKEDKIRTCMYARGVSSKIQYLKNATIPLEEDRTFVSKWLMKNTNKE